MTVISAGAMVGTPVRRVEDPTLLRGEASYVDNLDIEGVLNLGFVRSPFAHATLGAIDVEAARAMPGVVAVHSSRDLDLPPFAGLMALHPDLTRPPLAIDRARFAGDLVVAVLAETRALTVDAAELVEVDYEPLTPVVDMEAALAPGAPTQTEKLPTNFVLGDRAPDSVDPLGGAEVIARARIENQRVAVVPMEGAAVAVIPGDDGDGHDLTIYLTSQMPHLARNIIAGLFGLDPQRIRVACPHVGGSFGGKHVCAETIVAVKLALEYQRPVKWVETRSENMLSLPHGRGQVQYAEMGFTRDGKITGAHYRVIGDAGAYGGFGGRLADFSTRTMAQGVYKVPKLAYDVAITLTNTTPMGAYRGAGRPEAAAMVERIMDIGAYELGMDPVEIRRQNLIQPDEFPFTTRTGAVYDSGNYEAALDEALRLADYDALRAEQAERRRRGDRLQLGIGISVYVEITGGRGGSEHATVEVHDDGTVTVLSGSSSQGQGHATTFSAIVADELGIPLESIEFIQSDTARVSHGWGTGGSRSVQIGGSAVHEASQLVVERAKQLAADLLEAAPEDVVVVPGAGLGVAGVPASAVGWGDLARAARDRGEALTIAHDFETPNATFPFGAHVSVVEVDMETGAVKPLRHIAVDDCGNIINPLLVEGQVHGGLATGIAQALWEQFVYDEDGNPLTSTLAEYGIPSAAELFSYETGHTETPSPFNPLGAKGIGESASVGSTPAVQNAVVDALSHLGVRHIDIPCTPERVWQTIQQAEAGTLPSPWREPPAIFATLPVVGGPHEEDEINL